MARKKVFDAQGNKVVTTSESKSGRIRNKLRNPYTWLFCELCYRTTEYSIALERQGIYKQLPNGHARPVAFTDALRDKAQRMADELVLRYESALRGAYGPFEASLMRSAYCDPVDMRGDHSVASFRDQVERYANHWVWATHGNMRGMLQLSGQPEGAPKPSKLYCSEHNPRRSEDARRNYQRDRRFDEEFGCLVEDIWRTHAGHLPRWHIDVHAQIRRYAYEYLQLSKKPIAYVDEFVLRGVTNGAEIGRRLDLSRQAISAVRRRHAQKDLEGRKELAERLRALTKKLFTPPS